jgi:hypothetical protein
MANSIVVRVRRDVRGPVGGVIVLWSVVSTWSLFVLVAHREWNSAAAHTAVWSTVLLGVILGVQRRTAMAWIAPAVAWSLSWLPLAIACMFRFGFWRGLLAGAVVAVGGWIVVSTAQVAVLFTVSTVIRVALRPFRRRDDVVIIDPDHHRG